MRGLTANSAAIRQLRKAKAWTQEDLAAACRCSSRTIRNAERGDRIDTSIVAVIAERLETSIATITESMAADPSPTQQNVKIVQEWLGAFMAADIQRIAPLHHPETTLELPGTEGMPGGGHFAGHEQVRDHLLEVFSIFEPLLAADEEFDAVDNLVFHRSTMTGKNRNTGYEFASRYFNEFEFQDGLIMRRMTISDLTEHRRCFGQEE